MLAQYLKALREWGRSANTIEKHAQVVRDLHAWAKTEHPNSDDIVGFLRQKKFGEVTRYSYYTTLSLYFRWLQNESLILTNPMLKVPKVKTPRKYVPKNVMSLGEVEKLLTQLPLNVKDPLKFRDRVILQVMFDGSLRRCEVSDLDIQDYSPNMRALRIRPEAGKNSFGRIIPISPKACELIELLVPLRVDQQNPAIFQNYKGQRISRQYISDLVRDLRNEAGIRTKATASSFRKSSASLMLKEGAPLLTISQILGHVNVDQTTTYTKVYPLQMEKMLREFHPREG